MARRHPFVLGLNPVMSLAGEDLEDSARALTAYLGARLDRPIVLGEEKTYQAQIASMRAGSLDAALFGAYAFYRAREDAGAIALAVSVKPGSTEPRSYQSVLVAAADSRVRTLGDLRGLRVGFVDLGSTAGFLIPRRMLRDAGIDPDADIVPCIYPTHQAVLEAILAGVIEAGAVHRGVFAALAEQAGPAADRLRAIAVSPPVPTGPVAVRRDLDFAVRQHLLQALLTIHEDGAAARLVLAPESRFRPVSGRSVTLKMVAALASTSYGTVSRVINNEGRVAQATHARVMSVVQDLGYHPNPLAVGLVAQRSDLVGILAANTDTSLEAYLHGTMAVLRARDLHTVLCLTDGNRDEEARYLDLLEGGRFCALLLTPWSRDTLAVASLAAAGYAMVMLGAAAGGPPVPSVAPDFEQALALARGHLCDLGHRYIAALVAPQLLGAALRCLQQADPSGSVVAAIHDDEPDEVRPALTRLLSTSPPPTAIICGSERIALGALRVARELGLDVPAALSIVALGESWVAQASTPPLTAVSLPLAALGEQAARMLLKQMAGESPVPALDTVPLAALTPRGSSARRAIAPE